MILTHKPKLGITAFWTPFLCVMYCLGCFCQQQPASLKKTLEVIADPSVSTNVLIRALSDLRETKTTNEPPQFWNDIANNPRYSNDHRRRAILQLFARHIRPGMTFGDISKLLNHPKWLEQTNISMPRGLAGPLPFSEFRGGNESFGIIEILPRANDKGWPVIWLLLEGDADRGEVYECLKEMHASSRLKNIKVKEIVSQETSLDGSGPEFNQFGIPSYPHVNSEFPNPKQQ